MKKIILLFLLVFCCSLAQAATKVEPLPVDQAFQLSAMAKDPQTVVLHWKIAKNYYLYRKRIHFKLQHPKTTQLGSPIFPPGVPKYDRQLGHYQAYENEVDVATPVLQSKSGEFDMLVTYQGCSSEGFCYPPTTKLIQLSLNKNFSQSVKAQNTTAKGGVAPLSAQGRVEQLISVGHFFSMVVSFIGFGLLLAFTPCVLPMVPILSGIIANHGHKATAAKGFMLSLVYVLAMSVTYAVAGLLIGYLGGNVQAAMQKPWVIILFSAIFVLMAFSLFGFYDLQLPKSWQAGIAGISNRQKSGSYVGVFLMGVLATLIVSPCVTPALVGALAYISRTGNALLGGSALFALGFGMGIPLLVIGAAGGKFLPHVGTWMNSVKAVFGVLLLAVAIWLLERVIPGPAALVLWAVLLIVSAVYMGLFVAASSGWAKFRRGVALVMLIYGIVLLVGASMGNSNPLQPLANLPGVASLSRPQKVAFKPVKTIQHVKHALLAGRLTRRFTILDFYADWCVACKEMDAKTFSNPQVQQVLVKFQLLRANVTANDADDKALEKKYGVIAPPTLVFFDTRGKMLKRYKIVGDMGPQQFLLHLRRILGKRVQ